MEDYPNGTSTYDGADDSLDEGYRFAQPASTIYLKLRTKRDGIVQRGRELAELTIPTILPPEDYEAGDPLPGNNQSTNAYCVNSLAGKLTYVALPPGQPAFTGMINEYALQPEIDKDPQLFANIELALAAYERRHRQKWDATPMASTFLGCIKLGLVVGDWLWRWPDLDCPTFHPPTTYVVKRTPTGQVLHCILKEVVEFTTLNKATREFVKNTADANDAKDLEGSNVDIYSCIKLVGGDEDKHWRYWQEYNGHAIPGTTVECDYEAPCMMAEWLIPSYGQDWGPSYCEEYRGDLFSSEVLESAINDGASIAALTILLVAPGSATSRDQFEKARNLSVLPGKEGDIHVFRSEKTGDFQFVAATAERVERRLSRAFLLQSSVQRTGERVTAEEIRRLGNELNQAMGGTYLNIGQGFQRRYIMRGIVLNSAKHDIPMLPKGMVDLKVSTGVDNVGRTTEETGLMELGQAANATFGPQGATSSLKGPNFMARLAAAKGIKPDGLVVTQQELDAQAAQAKQDAAKQEMLKAAAGPVAGAVAQHAIPHMMGAQMGAPPDQGAPPSGN